MNFYLRKLYKLASKSNKRNNLPICHGSATLAWTYAFSSEDMVSPGINKFMILFCASHNIFAGSEGCAEAKRRMLLLSRCVLMCVT
jgi:hypothetical protein